MANNRSPSNSGESMLAQGKARASGRGQIPGYASGGRASKAAMEKWEGSAADRREDMAGARRIQSKMARGGKAGC